VLACPTSTTSEVWRATAKEESIAFLATKTAGGAGDGLKAIRFRVRVER
jgi:hypothetical protein